MDAFDARAVWSTAFVNNLPDSSFLYIESGGSKDSDGKTEPRTLRHFPYKDADGKVDLPHLRNALARIPQSNLPAEVKAALTKKAQKILADNSKSAGGPDEFRFAVTPLVGVEVRDPQESYDNTWTMSGYAAVFDQETTLYDGKFVRVTESIDPRAFNRVFRDQGLHTPTGVVHFNLGHDMNRAVAATDVPAGQPGSLQLSADSRGLFYTARVSRNDPDGVALAEKMRLGVIRQASFAFRVAADGVHTTDVDMPDGRQVEQRRIVPDGISHLYDVCATPQGAYAQTVSQLRSLAAAIDVPFDPVGEAGLVRPGLGSENTVRPEREAVVTPRRLGRQLEDRISGLKRIA